MMEATVQEKPISPGVRHDLDHIIKLLTATCRIVPT